MAKEKNEKLAEMMQEAFALSRILTTDLNLSVEIFPDEQGHIQFSRRVYLRNFFAAVEGIVFVNKRLFLIIGEVRKIEFTEAEKAMLMEQNYRLDERGRAVIHPAKIKTQDDILFMLKMLAKSTDSPEIEVDRQSTGWRSFRDTMTVRNRITHPRHSSEMELTENEIQTLNQAVEWFSAIALAIGASFQGLKPLTRS